MNEQENNVPFFRFEDLRIYAKAMDYITWLYEKLNVDFENDNERFLVKSFLKSAHNIALNTAEGSSRNKAQFLYYLKMAKSAVRECVVFTEIVKNVGLQNEEDYEYSRGKLVELTKMIGSLIASLQRITNAPEGDADMDIPSTPYPDELI
ncbi:MAG: four helix bundle protein [Bacteroidales bacterium]|nr:four helix bundle protein [Bacteroidales bacterium]